MKLRSHLASALVLLCAVITLPATPNNSNTHNTINAVLGDVSFVQKFGKAPTEATNERLRIQTHLEYVENLLRKADVAHLSTRLRERRSALLDKLHDYRLAGEFPTNLDFPQERRPCFIDAAGNICAVGYLIEQTAGRALAERITEAHKYDFLADMQMPELTAWVEASGLTARECAMVQPQYFSVVIRDTNFKAFIVSPLTTTATNSAYRMEVRLQGFDEEYILSTSSNFYISFYSFNFGPEKTLWTTSGTRRSGTAFFNIPPMPSITVGTHQIVFTFTSSYVDEIGLPNRYITVTTFTITAPTSTRDLTLPSPITISPNPTNDVCMLALPENELHRVRLTNSLGTVVATLSEATGATALDVSALAAGVYFVEVESRATRRRWVQKMVKY